jgi:methionyl-tRNA formyltransferase
VDGEIDWTRAADAVNDLIRGVTPEPGASTMVDGARLKVLEAAIARDVPPLVAGEFALVGKQVLVGTASQPIELLRVQPAGRTAMDAGSWWRGRK